MRTFRSSRALAFVSGVVITLFANGASAQSVSRGRQIAERWCASCHLIGSRQARASADVPSFHSIARRELTDAQLAAFLSTPHPPMPNMSLSRAETLDVLTYLRSTK